jgi:hypothetical protein
MEVSSSGYQRYKVLWPLVPAMAMVMIDYRKVRSERESTERGYD